MNYGYDKSSKNWQEDKKLELASHLKSIIDHPKYTPKEYPTQRPYVEIDGLYDGVRIRKITHLTGKQREQLIKEADVVYEVIMKN